MARVFLSNSTTQKILYVVSHAVGVGCPNHTDDVLLVQFFLRVAMEPGGGKPGFSPPGEKPISIDGACGAHTLNYIKYFQTLDSERNPGLALVADGKVHPPRAGSPVGALTGSLLTIIALNIHYRMRRPTLLTEIQRDPLFPPGLRNSLVIE